MRQPQPLPDPPFLTIYTPTFRRPKQLTELMISIARQTAVASVEHLVFPDYVGYGILNGLWGRIPFYAEACRGRYVAIVGDDDVLADEHVVARVAAFAEQEKDPEVIVAPVTKNGLLLPSRWKQPPDCGDIDLSNFILRRDVWVRHKADYGMRYEGDYDHAMVLHRAGYRHAFLDGALWVEGRNSHGRPEVDWH